MHFRCKVLKDFLLVPDSDLLTKIFHKDGALGTPNKYLRYFTVKELIKKENRLPKILQLCTKMFFLGYCVIYAMFPLSRKYGPDLLTQTIAQLVSSIWLVRPSLLYNNVGSYHLSDRTSVSYPLWNLEVDM